MSSQGVGRALGSCRSAETIGQRLRWWVVRARTGPLRLRALFALRAGQSLMRRRPVATTLVPRPPRLARGQGPLTLSHVVVSSDLNVRYLDCWPLVQRAWREIAGLEPLLVLIANEAPPDLRADPNVCVFEPVDVIHTALQAQCIRLLYPALIEGASGVLVSDVDMVPLNRSYFHRPAAMVDERHFLAYRDVFLGASEIPICYNAAHPRTWGEIFRVDDPDDVRSRLLEWGAGLRYDAIRGGHGWDTDQVILYRTLVDRARQRRDVWILDDRFTRLHRLESPHIGAGGPAGALAEWIRRGLYSDFHLELPAVENAEMNRKVVDLAAEGRMP